MVALDVPLPVKVPFSENDPLSPVPEYVPLTAYSDPPSTLPETIIDPEINFNAPAAFAAKDQDPVASDVFFWLLL